MSVFFNNGPGTTVGAQIGILVTKGALPVAPEDVEDVRDGDVADDGGDD